MEANDDQVADRLQLERSKGSLGLVSRANPLRLSYTEKNLIN